MLAAWGSVMNLASNPVELIPIDEISGAAYNPRQALRDRLTQVENSLLYLGFVLPLYINSENVLLSGHQRTKVARSLGYTKVPVVRVNIPKEIEKGMNLRFNQITNDLEKGDNSATALFDRFVRGLSEEEMAFSPIEPDTYYPCMDAKPVELRSLVESVGSTVNPFLRETALAVVRYGVHGPLVMSEGKILNGRARFYASLHTGYTHMDVVEVPPEKAAFAYYCLNFLSMDFNLQEAMHEELRVNAFRRLSVDRLLMGLSRTWAYPVHGKNLKTFKPKAVSKEQHAEAQDIYAQLPNKSEECRKAFRRYYGKTVVDFGAGTFRDAEILREAGHTVLAFEPYVLDQSKVGEVGNSGYPSRELSVLKAREFLEGIKSASITGIDSIVSSYVLNSVPHHKDRMAVLCLIASLCRLDTKAIIGTQSVDTKQGSFAGYISADMEPNMTLGLSLSAFKVQKFFHTAELRDMLKVFWSSVEVKKSEKTLYGFCRFAKKIPVNLLKEAIELEFDLPYEDGGRMGLVDEAKDAFGTYLGIVIP